MKPFRFCCFLSSNHCFLLCTVKSPFPIGIVGIRQHPSPLGHCHLVLVSFSLKCQCDSIETSPPPCSADQAGTISVALQTASSPTGPIAWMEKPVRVKPDSPAPWCAPAHDELGRAGHNSQCTCGWLLSQPLPASCHPSPVLFSAPTGQGTDLQACCPSRCPRGDPKASVPFLQIRMNFSPHSVQRKALPARLCLSLRKREENHEHCSSRRLQPRRRSPFSLPT